MNADAVAGLLHELGHSVPAMPNAACRAHVPLFDSEKPDDIARAIEICCGCVELESCRRWAASQPSRRLVGVVAGTFHKFNRRNCEPTAHQ